MTDKPKNEEAVGRVRQSHEPLPIDKAAYVIKARKVAPVIARKHCQLDQIDAALLRVKEQSKDFIEDEDGELVETDNLAPEFAEVLGICATIAQMLREEWTYK